MRWFCQFAALYRASGQLYFGYDNDWLYLEDFASPLLWQLIREADGLGIRFVGTKANVEVLVAERAELALDARAHGDGITVTTTLTIDGQQHSPQAAGAIGSHGVYVVQQEPHTVITLAPVTHPLAEAQSALLGRAATLSVPAAETQEFLDISPRLRRTIPLTSSDDSVQFPPVLAPVLVLHACFEPGHELQLTWTWEQRAYRDRPAEAALLARAGAVLQPWQPHDTVLRDTDAAEFTEHILPALEALEGVRVEVAGTKPDYRELTGAPEFTVTTVETDQRDWFDLGCIVSIDGRTIPFATCSAHCRRAQTKLLLIDGSYLSLAQPAFEQLRDLIEEAGRCRSGRPACGSAATSRPLGGLRGTRRRDRAGRRVAGQRHRAAARLERVEPTALPTGLHATLRPYQLDGFDWLAFLWQHRLGGILADDMGLGKTLQTLALIAHARNREPREPRARSSSSRRPPCVSNWPTKAQRFAPELCACVGDHRHRGQRADDLAAEPRRRGCRRSPRTRCSGSTSTSTGRTSWAGLHPRRGAVRQEHRPRPYRCARDLTRRSSSRSPAPRWRTT